MKIVSMTLNIAQKMNIEVSGVFVGQNPVPNAFTTFAVDPRKCRIFKLQPFGHYGQRKVFNP